MIKRHKVKLNGVIYLFIVILLYHFILLLSSFYKITNNQYLKTILKDSNSYIKSDNDLSFLIKKILNTDNPFKIIERNLYNDSMTKFTFNEYVEPRVYIYNTHDQEKYISNPELNIKSDVLSASYMLKDLLNKMGIETIVEDKRTSKVLCDEKLDFYKSYNVSRNFIVSALENNRNLDLIIDLHRDSLKREQTYVEIDNKKYAKILFVVGKKYSTYKNNMDLSNKISDKIKSKYPSITRGIMMKDRVEQNGIYNQDLNPNIILLELGSNNNTFEEITNTLDILASAIAEVLNEN